MNRIISLLSIALFIACSEDTTTMYNLTVSSNPTGGGTINPSSGEYEEGTDVTLRANSNTYYEFDKWSGSASGSESTLKITMDSDKNIVGNFKLMDSDGDGVTDDIDLCKSTSDGQSVDSNGCSESQKDTDGDTVTDDLDQCPDTPNGQSVDLNGCSESQKDTDGDTVTDDLDQCPDTPSGETSDENGCSDSQKDSDGDGVTDDLDQCADTQSGETVNENGCSSIFSIEAYIGEITSTNINIGVRTIKDGSGESILEIGFVWGYSSDITTDSNLGKVFLGNENSPPIGPTQIRSYKIRNLSPNTSYYVTPYFINNNNQTFYGFTPLFFNTTSEVIEDVEGNSYSTTKFDINHRRNSLGFYFSNPGTSNLEISVENLKVKKYRNGDEIFHVDSIEDMNYVNSQGIGAWCYVNNDPETESIHGILYNQKAINDERGLVPIGFEITSQGDWEIVDEFVRSNGIRSYVDDLILCDYDEDYKLPNRDLISIRFSGGMRWINNWDKNGQCGSLPCFISVIKCQSQEHGKQSLFWLRKQTVNGKEINKNFVVKNGDKLYSNNNIKTGFFPNSNNPTRTFDGGFYEPVFMSVRFSRRF